MELRDLRIEIPTDHGVVVPTDGISLSLAQGEVLGVVGETGSGKTVTCRAMLGLLPTRDAAHSGTVTYPAIGPDDILSAKPAQLRRLWGDYVAMIPQNPMTSLDPIRRIGDQIGEAVTAHRDCSRAERRQRVVELMQLVGIPAPERRLDDYPHQFSGGMLQRTLIAIALAGNPKVLIADEPTTALDVIIQDQILSLLLELQRDSGMSMVLVSHDLGVIAEMCDRIAVMYAGEIVELADSVTLLTAPRHPYTISLLRSLPDSERRTRYLPSIVGTPPQLIDIEPGCRFVPRCPLATPECRTWKTQLLPAAGEGQLVRCRRHDESRRPELWPEQSSA
jgi:peptide/nickel transport system ATP-binding protein/oligopeptide transport system ATP-binding protein